MAKIAAHRILTLRTASTEWDESGRLQGSTDLPPSSDGLLEVQRQLAVLGRLRLSAVIAGPDEASVATARLLADASGSRVTLLDELSEIRFGLWEGILRSDLEDRFCRAGRQWDEDPTCVTPPDGESVEAFAARALPAIRRIVAKTLGKRTVLANVVEGRLGGGHSGVGVVLRPFADSLVRCVLAGRPSSEMCSILEARPQAQWFEVSPDHPWLLTPGPRRAPTVSVA